jgi:hypothetical protein
VHRAIRDSIRVQVVLKGSGPLRARSGRGRNEGTSALSEWDIHIRLGWMQADRTGANSFGGHLPTRRRHECRTILPAAGWMH